jgi:hypothetical protein
MDESNAFADLGASNRRGRASGSNLYQCPDCEAMVSVRAESCPKCGCPFDTRETRRREHYQPRVQMIEKTGKRWKAAMLIGALLTIVGCSGILLAFSAVDHNLPNASSETGKRVALWLLLAVPGFIIYVIARVGAWWNHG